MKVLEIIQSLFVPTHMYKRRKMNILISILIMVLGLFALSTPISMHLSKNRYEAIGTQFDFVVFEHMDPEDVLAFPITDEEREKYNMISFEELKELGVAVSNAGFSNTEKIEAGKDYVLKSLVPVYDDEGSISDYIVYYVHIVFETGKENLYDIKEKFDKLPKENDVFNHFLLVFQEKGFVYRSTYEIDNKTNPSTIFYSNDITIDFSKIEKGLDISHPLIDMMVPMYRYQYQIRAAIYAVLFPTLMACLFAFVLKRTGLLKGFREYFNMAAVSSIPFLLFSMITSFISIGLCNLIFQYYTFIFIIYYFIVIVITNRKNIVE